MRQQVVDRETAQNDFNRFVEAMDLRLDRETMDKNDRRDIDDDIDVIIWEIMYGILSVNDEGAIVLHSKKYDKDITFHEPSPAHMAAMDRQKEHQKMAQMYSLIPGVCDAPASVIKHQLTQHEFDSCSRIYSLFFVK